MGGRRGHSDGATHENDRVVCQNKTVGDGCKVEEQAPARLVRVLLNLVVKYQDANDNEVSKDATADEAEGILWEPSPGRMTGSEKGRLEDVQSQCRTMTEEVPCGSSHGHGSGHSRWELAAQAPARAASWPCRTWLGSMLNQDTQTVIRKI